MWKPKRAYLSVRAYLSWAWDISIYLSSLSLSLTHVCVNRTHYIYVRHEVRFSAVQPGRPIWMTQSLIFACKEKLHGIESVCKGLDMGLREHTGSILELIKPQCSSQRWVQFLTTFLWLTWYMTCLGGECSIFAFGILSRHAFSVVGTMVLNPPNARKQ